MTTMCEPLAEAVVSRLKAANLTLATAESCTGGLIGKLLTDVPGSSAVYMGGVISYTNQVKRRLLGVQPDTLRVYTAVSRQAAHEMALGAREVVQAELHLPGNRAMVRKLAAEAVLELILEFA